jgi:predicted O-methyltransferase YrrM
MNGLIATEPGPQERKIEVIMHFMAMSQDFRAHRRRLARLVGAGEVTDQDVEDLLRAVVGELRRMADARAVGRLSQGALGYGTQQIRDLLSELLGNAGLAHATKTKIRHFLIDHLELRLMEFPDMRFTQDWFSIHEEHWLRHFAYFAGRAGLRFLEIGSFEGRSACWLLSTLLGGPECVLICVDTFDAHPEQESNFDHNIRKCGAEHRVLKLRGRSEQVLPLLEAASFDFIYVDGSHGMLDVLGDAAEAWRLASPGGVVVFDDYCVSAGRPAAGSCGSAVDGFLTTVAGHYEVVFSDWQLAVRKRDGSGLPALSALPGQQASRESRARAQVEKGLSEG